MNKLQLRKLQPLLKLISNLSDDERRIVLKYLNTDGLDGVYQCIHNGVSNNTIPQQDRLELKEKLSAQKRQYRALTNIELDPEKKRKKLVEVGDSVGHVIKLVLPVLESHLK